jgi:hypothetical protein
MNFPTTLVGAPLLRSYICEHYELRITRRCLEEDLGRDPDSEFAELLEKATPEIVRALVGKRSDSPTDRSEIAPLTSGRTVYRLAYGNDHRGGTWHDERFGVVWLLAYRLHRSGEPDDAFPYMKDLDARGLLLPSDEDYKALFDDRGRRAAIVAPKEAQELLAEARANEGVEVRGTLGEAAGVGVVVEVVETLEETAIAFDVTRVPPAWVTLIPIWFFPESRFEDWDPSTAFPTRDLAPTEICLRHLKSR